MKHLLDGEAFWITWYAWTEKLPACWKESPSLFVSLTRLGHSCLHSSARHTPCRPGRRRLNVLNVKNKTLLDPPWKKTSHELLSNNRLWGRDQHAGCQASLTNNRLPKRPDGQILGYFKNRSFSVLVEKLVTFSASQHSQIDGAQRSRMLESGLE